MSLNNFTVNQLRKFLTGYNKIEKKRTYKKVYLMKKKNLIDILNKDFKPNFRNKALYLKHKTGRYTKKIKKK